MKTQRIDFKDELPAAITVELTLDEAVLITRLLGMESGDSLTNKGLVHLATASHDVYNGLTGNVFNPYWENGVFDL